MLEPDSRHPSARSAWRVAILAGENQRTYKFALGAALLELAAEGHEQVSLVELTMRYALGITEHTRGAAQAPTTVQPGPADFLTVVAQESAQTLQRGRPTERLVDAAVRNMPEMVMTKFHNAAGGVGHTFYELHGRGPQRTVALTPALHALTRSTTLLREELDARWAIVETAFDAGVSRSLVSSGLRPSPDGETLHLPARRVAVTSSRPALSGFQDGRCFACEEPLPSVARGAHVDHVYPWSWMRKGLVGELDLNGLWNLVVTCAACNQRKSDARPSAGYVRKLVARNEAVMTSPVSLKNGFRLSYETARPGSSRTAETRRRLVRDVELLLDGRGTTVLKRSAP